MKRILIFLFGTILCVASQNCRLRNSNQVGVCQSFSSCQRAQYNYRYRNVQPTICFYNQLGPIVCCANNRARPTITITTEPPISKITPNPQQIDSRISGTKCRNASPNNVYSIVGGVKTRPKEFPFMVAIGWRTFDNEYDFNCGGFLVEQNFVITAAHCTNLGGSRPSVVKIGGDNLSSTSSEHIPIQKIIVHPKYNQRQTYNDIAILKLQKSSVNLPGCLWQTNDLTFNNLATAIGYGHTQFAGAKSDDLLKANLKLFGNQECSKYYKPAEEYPKGIISSQLCAGDPTGSRDTCQGDSGGPLIISTANKNYVVGLTSFGSGCAGGAPSIYIRISSYLNWIESVVWPDG